ncbi:molybdenum cofactor guanylyltransferase [Paenibacillus piri]|uniref:Probable molybdenum cofactor guanylyltransferase n=1 Tax=Paenibacillus piri TaxID=2547395 RepID=A0A4R5KBF9_9BACL|nr:molybdenum cofactor guanylyltransferase [Paenibacillus piri]TDF91865.1 molybdenum cofactor guanylyltransferase [Paenibacillus piri]
MAAESNRVQPITGVILAGGGNRRMGGRPKALLDLNGERFIDRQLTEMSLVCSEIIIAANEASLFNELPMTSANVRVIPDLQPGKGPLAGLQAAIAAASYDELWVVACDMPCLSAAAAETLLNLRRRHEADGSGDAAVPLLYGKTQPLHAVYHRRCGRIIGELLAASRHRMMDLLDRLDYAAVGESTFTERGVAPVFAENVNTPEDLERLRQRGNP